MSDIEISHLTNVTADTFGEGTGVFDKLMQSVTLHIEQQYDDGKITGTDYANVYLGSLQSIIQQSMQFLLTEQRAGKEADLVDSQIRESEEKIDLIAAQTAKEYEAISASQSNTVRENILNNKQVIKLQKEAVFIEKQTDKIDAEVFKVNADVLKINAEIADQEYITTNIRPEELLKIQEEVDLLQSRDLEQLAATVRNDAESTQKIALMSAQTLGFASDTKQKILKIMTDGYAVNLSISGTATAPDATKDIAIDALASELLNDIGSSVVIT